MLFDILGFCIPFIVGTAFWGIGVGMLCTSHYFSKNGRKLNGIVKAIEEYQSESIDSGNRHIVTLYRPIVEYTYQGQTRILKGVGSGEISHKIKQNVPILVLDDPDSDKIKARLANDSFHMIIGIVFLFVGLCAFFMLGVIDGMWVTALSGLVLATVCGRSFSSLACKFKLDIHSSEDEQFISPNSILIDSPNKLQKTLPVHGFWGNIAAYILLIVSFGVMYAAYTKFPEDKAGIVFSDFNAFRTGVVEGQIPDNVLILFGMGCFMLLCALRSIYYVSKKYAYSNRI